MKILSVIVCSSILTFSGCAIYQGVSEENKQKFIDKSLVSMEERDAILAEVETLPNVDSNKPKWLFVKEYDNVLISGHETTKSYLDVNSVLRFKNVAFGNVKTISPTKNYSVTTYRVFCQEGYIRKYKVTHYNENDEKRSELLSSLSKNAYDEQIGHNNESIAKSICALAGFYKGMDSTVPSISAVTNE